MKTHIGPKNRLKIIIINTNIYNKHAKMRLIYAQGNIQWILLYVTARFLSQDNLSIKDKI